MEDVGAAADVAAVGDVVVVAIGPEGVGVLVVVVRPLLRRSPSVMLITVL